MDNKSKKTIVVSGKRKTSVAKAAISDGKGKIILNNTDYNNLHKFDKLRIDEPLKIAENILGKINFDIKVNVRGGGEKSQIDASRLAISKAIVAFTNSKELREAYIDYDKTLLVADTRRKETYKPGDSKARKKRQSSKR